MNKSTLKTLITTALVISAIIFVSNSDSETNEFETLQKLKTTTTDHVEGENPGAFYEALALLKTTKEGKTYGPNYKQIALDETQKFKNIRIARTPGIEGTQGEPLNWKVIGPGNVSGRTRAVVVDPADPSGNSWFAATIGGGVWKTTDSGQTWENKTPDILTLTTTTLAIANSNPDVIYVGTGMGYGRIVDLPGSGIWKSTDGGESWNQLQSTANSELFNAINRIIVDPNNENIVLACSNGFSSHLGPKSAVNGTYGEDRSSGIFRSTDGGASWTQVFDPDSEIGTNTDNRVQQLLADPTDFNTIYATVNEVGIVKSTDAGLTWTVITDSFAPSGNIGVPGGNGFGLEGISIRTEMAIAPTDPDRLYAAVERPQGQKPVFFMSTDAGESWAVVPDTGSDPNWFHENAGTGRNSAWFNNTILVSPYDEDLVFVGGVNLYKINIDPANVTRTTQPIAWWIPNNQGLPVIHADYHFISSIPVDENAGTFKLIVANDGGVGFSEDNGVNWTQLTGLITTQFYGIDKKPGENVYVGGMQDNGTWLSPKDPATLSQWTEVGGGDGVEVAWNGNDPDQIIIGSQGGNLSRSTDGGATFAAIPAARAGVSPFISKVANNKTDPELVFTVGLNGVMRSDNFGETWTLTPVTGNWLGYRPFDNVEISIADPRTVWISSRMDVEPASGARGGIHISRDGGLSFEEISTNFPANVTEASGIGTDPLNGGTAYFLFSEPGAPKVLKTTDYGQTFTDLSGFSDGAANSGFPDVGVFSLLVMPYNTDILWAGTEIGLFISEDGGQTWLAADNGMPNVAIFQMSIVDNQVLVGTHGRGIWTVEIPELADYVPPVSILTPRFQNLAMSPEGNGYRVDVELRSAYDSTHLLFDGQLLKFIGANSEPGFNPNSFEATQDKSINVQVIGYKDGSPYKSGIQTLRIFPFVPVNAFSSELDLPSDNNSFVSTGFRIRQEAGFSTSALHSTHPYPNGAELIAMLKNPIIVANQEAFMFFDEVVLVEEGVVNDFTNAQFFDYVIVEGTKDGLTWLPLINGYDSRANGNWSATYQAGITGANSTSTGSEAIYAQSASIDLLSTFTAGDQIFIRFRLLSDPLTFAWGWAIDNIQIQETITGFQEEVEQGNLAVQSYPNPTKGDVTIRYFLPKPGPVNLNIVDIKGQPVLSEAFDFQNPGFNEYHWNSSEQTPGIYLIKIQTPSGTVTSKMMKIE